MMLLGNRTLLYEIGLAIPGTGTYFMELRPISNTRAVGDHNKGMVLEWVEFRIVVFLADWIVETCLRMPPPTNIVFLDVYCTSMSNFKNSIQTRNKEGNLAAILEWIHLNICFFYLISFKYRTSTIEVVTWQFA